MQKKTPRNKIHIKLKVQTMLDYADPIVHIRILTNKLQNQLNDKKISEAYITIDKIDEQTSLIVDWLQNQSNSAIL